MIPEPAPAQLRLCAWVDDDLGSECHAMSCACEVLLEQIQSAEHTHEAALALYELLVQHANIGRHLGWPNWRAVCAHAQSLITRCATDGVIRDWIVSLFRVTPTDAPTSDLFDSCPVPRSDDSSACVSRWEAQALSMLGEAVGVPPWVQHVTDVPASELLHIPEPRVEQSGSEPKPDEAELSFEEEESLDVLEECAQVKLNALEVESTDHVVREGVPLVVFRASGRLLALRASCVASVVRKARSTTPLMGAEQTDKSGYETHDPAVLRECTHPTPEEGGEDRFEIVLDGSGIDTTFPVQACLGVHTSRVVPVLESAQSIGVAGVATIPGAGVALVYEVEEYVERATQQPAAHSE